MITQETLNGFHRNMLRFNLVHSRAAMVKELLKHSKIDKKIVNNLIEVKGKIAELKKEETKLISKISCFIYPVPEAIHDAPKPKHGAKKRKK